MRKHYFDNGKAVASFLGIIYHSALVFSGVEWVINVNAQQSLPILHVYTDYINLFRMPLFLFISGYFAAYSVKKYNLKEFTLNKLTRLGIPLISTILTFNMIEKFYTDRFNHENHTLIETWSTLIPWSSNFELLHLWFLYYVIIFSFVIYICSSFKTFNLSSLIKYKSKRYIDVIFIVCSIGIFSMFGGLYFITDFSHELLSFLTIGANFPYFLLGVITYLKWEYLESTFFNLSIKRTILIFAFLIISYILIDIINDVFSNSNAVLILNTLPRYFSLILILALLYKYLNKSNRFLKYMSESSYSVYLIHQPVIVVISYYYIKYMNFKNPLFGYLIVFIVSTIIIYALDYILIRNTKFGAFMFTGKRSLRNDIKRNFKN